MPAFGGRSIAKNVDKLIKPFESPCYSAHFIFSYGKLLIDAGYDKAFTDINVFHWEEPYSIYLAWKAGYTVYSPNQEILWHLFRREDRLTYEEDLFS